MSRVINPQPVGKERKQYLRAIVLALGELMRLNQPDAEARDLVAFIVLTLTAVERTVEQTVLPWERRGYWVKADRFQQEWVWVTSSRQALADALQREAWPEIASIAARLVERLRDLQLPRRHNIGRPWVGAWDRLGDELDRKKG